VLDVCLFLSSFIFFNNSIFFALFFLHICVSLTMILMMNNNFLIIPQEAKEAGYFDD